MKLKVGNVEARRVVILPTVWSKSSNLSTWRLPQCLTTCEIDSFSRYDCRASTVKPMTLFRLDTQHHEPIFTEQRATTGSSGNVSLVMPKGLNRTA